MTFYNRFVMLVRQAFHATIVETCYRLNEMFGPNEIGSVSADDVTLHSFSNEFAKADKLPPASCAAKFDFEFLLRPRAEW